MRQSPNSRDFLFVRGFNTSHLGQLEAHVNGEAREWCVIIVNRILHHNFTCEHGLHQVYILQYQAGPANLEIKD